MAITRLNNNSITSITALPSAVTVDNAPYFHAITWNGNQSPTANTWTKAPYFSEVFDPDGVYDTTNNYFTVPSGKAGKYFFYATVWGPQINQSERCAIRFYRDVGSGFATSSSNGTGEIQNWASYNNEANILQISTTLDLSVGDKVAVYYLLNNGSSYANELYNRFLGYKLI